VKKLIRLLFALIPALAIRAGCGTLPIGSILSFAAPLEKVLTRPCQVAEPFEYFGMPRFSRGIGLLVIDPAIQPLQC
jgi:hypothetical protein